MKRVFAVIVAAVMMLCCVPLAGFAEEEELPLVILQGYSGPTLIYNQGQEDEKKVWGIDGDAVKDKVIERIPELALSVGGMAFGDYDRLVKTVGEVMVEMLDVLRCNPDGSSVSNLSVYPQGAAATRSSTLQATGEANYIAEAPLAEDFMGAIGAENVFTFTTDWRMGQVESAANLDKYIQEVKALTGKDKVNIYALSHGGQLGAAYLYYYGEKADVNKIILNVPAIGGTWLVHDLLMAQGKFEVYKLIEFIEIGFRNEDEWEWLVEAIGFDRLNEAFYSLLQEYVLDIVRYWGSIWDFVPLECYDELKAKFLDEDRDAGLIAKSDKMHYDAMAHMSEGLKRAQKAGVNIAIMSNTGRDLASTTGRNSDYIIDVNSSSGAYVAPYGESFAEDHTPKNTTCADKSHYHISPGRDIDASSAYLPDNTWFINGQYHGQSNWDRYTRSFYMEFLFEDTITDIYSNPDYPQFENSQNPADGLYVRFNKTLPGFCTGRDTEFSIENLSEQYDTTILKVECSADGIEIGDGKARKMGVGESLSYDVKQTAAPESGQSFTVTVTYSLQNGKIPFVKTKDFSFTYFDKAAVSQYKILGGGKGLTGSALGSDGTLTPDTGATAAAAAWLVLAAGAAAAVGVKRRRP